MFGERANRVLGSVGNRSRFFTATLFLLSTFATSVWTDNSTGSIGECAFFGYPGGILSAPGGGQNRIFVSHIFHFAHVYYLLVYMKISSISFNFFPFFHLHPSLQTLDFAFKREKKFSSGRVASSSRCNQRLSKIAVKFFFAIEKLVHRSFFISRPHRRFPCPSCIVESKIFPRFSSTFDQKYKYRKKEE